jgi:hypothetical protein
MLASLPMRWLTGVLAIWVIAAAPSRAETNAPALLSDPELFFAKYREAVTQFNAKRPQEAGILLDGLVKQLRTSPWLDVALLKHAELIERSDPKTAMEDYSLLQRRLQNVPYYQGKSERALLFGEAIGGAVNAGINRIRAARIREALDKYFARHAEYPESLTKLAILSYIEVEDIHDAAGNLFRYVPTGMQLAPFISYKRYEGLTFSPPEPLVVAAPRVEGISALEEPGKHTALANVPGRLDAARVVENQTLDGYLILAIGRDGVLVCNRQRVLVLLAPVRVAP